MKIYCYRHKIIIIIICMRPMKIKNRHVFIETDRETEMILNNQNKSLRITIEKILRMNSKRQNKKVLTVTMRQAKLLVRKFQSIRIFQSSQSKEFGCFKIFLYLKINYSNDHSKFFKITPLKSLWSLSLAGIIISSSTQSQVFVCF